MNTREHEGQDTAAFERIADLRFKQETEQMYDEEIAKVNELVEKYENAGIASAGKFVDKTADLVLSRFKKIEGIFKEIYLKHFEGAADSLTEASEDWLRKKVPKVIGDQVATAQGMTKNLCWKFQPLPKDRLSVRWARVQDEGRYMQQRLGEAITLLVLTAEEQKDKILITNPAQKAGTTAPQQHALEEVSQTVPEMLVFISHSGKDEALALALIELLRAALGLRDEQIRCTSVDGYRLEAGANTNEQLKLEVRNAKAFIGLITPYSMASAYVLFELGARWGANLHMIPVLAGVEPDALEGPLKGINAISAKNISQLHQLVQNLGTRLSLPMQAAASYTRYAENVIEQVSRMSVGIRQQVLDIHKPEIRHRTPGHNIQCVGVRVAKLAVLEDSVIVERADGEVTGGLVCFRNVPIGNESVESIENVTAHVVYKDANGNEVADIPAAFWLKDESDMVDLKIGKTLCVIVLAQTGNKRLVFWKERCWSAEYPPGDIISDAVKEIPSTMSTIEVHLIGEDGMSLPAVAIDAAKWPHQLAIKSENS